MRRATKPGFVGTTYASSDSSQPSLSILGPVTVGVGIFPVHLAGQAITKVIRHHKSVYVEYSVAVAAHADRSY